MNSPTFLNEIENMASTDHMDLLNQIPWNKSNYIQRKDEISQIENYFLQESSESEKIRKEYAQQEYSSTVLLQINKNKIQKLDFIQKSSSKQTKPFKCLICQNASIFGKFTICKICHDYFHLECFNKIKDSERGQFFHENGFEKDLFQSFDIFLANKIKKGNESNMSAVYWVCQKCTNRIIRQQKIWFKLEFPFQIQTLPTMLNYKVYTTSLYNTLIGDLDKYHIPENLEEAVNEKGMVFQDDCVYLTNAKVNHNSIRNSRDSIDVRV